MNGFATAVICGTLGKAVEYFGEGDKQRGTFSLAVNTYKGPDKPKQTDWYNITIFGRLIKYADTVLPQKGDVATVTGHIQWYEDKDGVKRLSMVAESCEFIKASLIGKENSGSGSSSSSGRSSASSERKSAPVEPGDDDLSDLPF